MATTGSARAVGKLGHGSAASALVRASGMLLAVLAAVLWLGAAGALASPAGGGLTQSASAGTSGGLPAVGATPFAESAPKITKQPVSITVTAGQPASFEAEASGSPTPTVQWEELAAGTFSYVPIEGATSDVYTIPVTKASESGSKFRARFKSNTFATVTKEVVLTVQQAPLVTLQPTSKTTEEGHAVSFESTATGSPAPTVQWQSEPNGGTIWKTITGATSTVLTISSPKTSESQTKYRAVFKNSVGEATSEAATLTVANSPKITKQPVDTTVEEGALFANFEAAATGPPTPTVQWEVSTDGGSTFTPIPGATTIQLTVELKGGESFNGNKYRAVFTNVAGSVVSNAATLTVESKPIVTKQPSEALVLAGETASFEAIGKAIPGPSVQWEASTDDGASWTPVPGATATVLTIAETQLSQNRNLYRAAFTNKVGTTDSSSARLFVASASYEAFGWGMNTHGEVGSGSTEASIPTPMPVKALRFVTALAAGAHHSLALLANGRVDSWGWNTRGQLGHEGLIQSRVPVNVVSVKSASAVSAGGNDSMALLENGTVMAWGNNDSGQLGNGSHTESEFAFTIPGLTNVTALAEGEEHSLALLENGTVMAWGNNERGQLGTGNKASSTTPVPIEGLSNVAAISAAGNYSLALLKDGTVMAWGDDEHGQLGSNRLRLEQEEEIENGSEARKEAGYQSDVPVAVEGLSAVKQIDAGRTHALALLEDGTVMAWGENIEGELGDESMGQVRVDTPVAVSALSGVTQVSAGEAESGALLASGSVEAWGNNRNGQLGQGTTGEDSDVPVTVSSLAGAVGIAAGGSHILAFGASLPSVTGVSPKAGALTGGTSVTITGSGLGNATGVKFGSASAPSFTVNSSTSVTATAPAGSGTVDVTVVTPGGSSPPTSADRFTYRPAPVVEKLSVKSGPATGGTVLTITGKELSGVSEVDFAGVPGTGLSVASNFSLTVTAPADLAGTTDVRLQSSYGESPTSTKDHFKYLPVISGFSPPSAPIAGGTTIEVSGAGFALGAASKFKFGKANAKSVNCTSATTCVVVAPAAAGAGTVDVRVTAEKAKSALEADDRFTYE